MDKIPTIPRTCPYCGASLAGSPDWAAVYRNAARQCLQRARALVEAMDEDAAEARRAVEDALKVLGEGKHDGA